MGTPEDPRLLAAKQLVQETLKAVHDANEVYVNACKNLATVKMDIARESPHPWLGMLVYRIQKGESVRHRAEHGIVSFKEYATPDYGNPHISPGQYYVLVDGKDAKWLDETWQLDLL